MSEEGRNRSTACTEGSGAERCLSASFYKGREGIVPNRIFVSRSLGASFA